MINYKIRNLRDLYKARHAILPEFLSLMLILGISVSLTILFLHGFAFLFVP